MISIIVVLDLWSSKVLLHSGFVCTWHFAALSTYLPRLVLWHYTSPATFVFNSYHTSALLGFFFLLEYYCQGVHPHANSEISPHTTLATFILAFLVACSSLALSRFSQHHFSDWRSIKPPWLKWGRCQQKAIIRLILLVRKRSLRLPWFLSFHISPRNPELPGTEALLNRGESVYHPRARRTS